MQSKKIDELYASPDLKRMGRKLVERRLSDDGRKMVVIAIALEPNGVSEPNTCADTSRSAVNEKALALLEARDLSPRSLGELSAFIKGMFPGFRALNHADVQNMRLGWATKYINLHADHFYYFNDGSFLHEPNGHNEKSDNAPKAKWEKKNDTPPAAQG